MTEQFPSDKIGDAIVHVVVAKFSGPGETTEFVRRAVTLMRDVTAGLQGFLEGRVLEADDGASVIVATHWATRHAWAAAQWDEAVGRALSESHASDAKIVDTICYVRATVRP